MSIRLHRHAGRISPALKEQAKNSKEKPILNLIKVIYCRERQRSDLVFKQLVMTLDIVISKALVGMTVRVFTFLTLFSRLI